MMIVEGEGNHGIVMVEEDEGNHGILTGMVAYAYLLASDLCRVPGFLQAQRPPTAPVPSSVDSVIRNPVSDTATSAL